MHINAEPRDTFTILHLRGEFDTYYCPLLQKEIDDLMKAGVLGVVLNLRLVKFINSTALGAIIKSSKQLNAKGGKLAISRPSAFCRDILEKVGLNRVVSIFDSDEEAGASMTNATAPQGNAEDEGFEGDESTVLFTPSDTDRIEHFLPEDERQQGHVNPLHGHSFGKNWSGVGRMAGLDGEVIRFTWNGGNTGLTPFSMSQLLAIGTDWKVKFRLPLLKRGYCEAMAVISEVEERPDGVKVALQFSKIDEETKKAVRQYAADMAFLKDELKKATDK
jgi:anti-sigma B factor antagonist